MQIIIKTLINPNLRMHLLYLNSSAKKKSLVLSKFRIWSNTFTFCDNFLTVCYGKIYLNCLTNCIWINLDVSYCHGTFIVLRHWSLIMHSVHDSLKTMVFFLAQSLFMHWSSFSWRVHLHDYIIVTNKKKKM